jgi:hypothetical protein
MSETTRPVLANFPTPEFNAFLMMSFEDTTVSRRMVETVRTEAQRYAINVLRSDDQTFLKDLWENVKAYMDACRLGIAIFEQPQFNPNVSLEVGYMLAKNAQVLLLKELGVPTLHADLVGALYKKFDLTRLEPSMREAVRLWLRDIGVAKRPLEKLVVFVSEGGQDRCAMAKVVARKLFERRSPPFQLRFESLVDILPVDGATL